MDCALKNAVVCVLESLRFGVDISRVNHGLWAHHPLSSKIFVVLRLSNE